MNDPSPLLQLERVSRRLGGRTVVRELDLRLARGQVLGLLGVNGAGKSTTLAMMAGAQQPDRGCVRLQGVDLAEQPQRARTDIGWLPERAPLWPELNVIEHLDASARLRGLRGAAVRKRRDALLERLQLQREARRLVAVLSQGQRQRVGLACALLHEPPLLVLDEPGNGLDPLQAAQLRELIRERAAAGCGVVLSTHLLPEVTAVCDRVAILHEGALRHDAPLHAGRDRLLLTLAQSVDAAHIAALTPVAQVQAQDACRYAITLRDDADAPALVQAAVAAGLAVAGVQPVAGELEQAFMRIATQHAASASEQAQAA
ncbi:ABC transporter ATP-binding protein [Oleiagrimonas soli]|uniref:ABC transporter n=1 Tax=Oleiagrimonas soli TaxID=1543381 RepID=A0A099D1B1_9GAMM|nr:ABC transporter ATP-binding protein [Oleiagrimonas soli]KGI79065.1 ABC transporter [Oleiagrimonas soli]MBB6184737.1 ABC-2 type transport system ATP-binding protein [Oleiagrimonas soli]